MGDFYTEFSVNEARELALHHNFDIIENGVSTQCQDKQEFLSGVKEAYLLEISRALVEDITSRGNTKRGNVKFIYFEDFSLMLRCEF